MRLEKVGVTPEEALLAVDSEIDHPPGLLPLSVVNPTLAPLRVDVAAWAVDRYSDHFFPTMEEVIAVSKASHGIRPVAIWDLSSRLLYGILATRLGAKLPPLARSHRDWIAFLWSPLNESGKYVVAADIAACYQYIDHGLLADELLVQTADHRTVDAATSLLEATSGRSYGLPQQSIPSDRLADCFLDGLERALVRRGLKVARYNDDFRFTCDDWSSVIECLEIFSDEARLIGLTPNDAKTLTWKRDTYQKHLAEAENLRRSIADEAQFDLTDTYLDGYDSSEVLIEPHPTDVKVLAATRLLVRWGAVGGQVRVPADQQRERAALLSLIPAAFSVLNQQVDTQAEVLEECRRLLRFEKTMTPRVAGYLSSRTDHDAVLGCLDQLLQSSVYLNDWQRWWLSQSVGSFDEFGAGSAGGRRALWVRETLEGSAGPMIRAHAAQTLALHKQISQEEILALYRRASIAVRPVLVAALAKLEPSATVARSVTADSRIHEWVFEGALPRG